jgi:DNA primase
MPNVLADIYSQMLLEGPRQHRLEWLYERGLHLETIARSKIGHDGNRFVIPIFSEGGDLISLRFRRDDAYMEDPTPKYCGVKGRNGLYVYGEDWIDIDDRALVICEGELDVVRLRQEGITAVTATNGAGQTHKLPKIIAERWPHITTLYIATDMDEPGEEAARQTLKACAGLSQFWARRLTWPEGKDVTDAYTHGCFPAVG